MKRLKKGYLIFGYYTIFGLALVHGILALWGGYLEAVTQLLSAPIIFLLLGFKALFAFLFLPILNCWTATLPFLKKPLKIDLGISWAILALISMLTLTYVQLINSLSEHLHKHKDDQKASWRKVFLAWTTGMHFITILFLTLRITYLSFDPEAYQNSCSKLLIFSDWIILTSFFLGSFMRIHIFFDSYGEDFTKHIWKHL